MAKTYTLHVAGLTRELPICKINDHLDIAAFIMFSDVELTIACAKALLEKCPDFDVILTAEAKGIPLAYEMSRQSDKKDLDYMNGKRILVVDDVISTGGSLHALDALAARSSGTIVAQAAVLAEGDAAERKDIIFLEPLPLFAH